MARTAIETGFLLDQLWHLLQGEMDRSKEPALLLIGRIFAEAGVPNAVIGGIALQVHQPEPRTTLDIDLAVLSRADIPRGKLESAGFTFSGLFAHSENWLGPGDTPVQVTDDPALAEALGRRGGSRDRRRALANPRPRRSAPREAARGRRSGSESLEEAPGSRRRTGAARGVSRPCLGAQRGRARPPGRATS